MFILAQILFVTLTLIAALHFYWALGGLWPAASAQELANTVIGTPDHPYMPGTALTVLVSGMIFAAALLPIIHVTGLPFELPKLIAKLGLAVLVLVFLARGIGTYLMPSLLENATEPFRTLNYRYYSPLCIALGAGFATLLANSWKT